ncbi:MAG TPA: phosphoribosylglycinamide formyltransferase [Bacillota bacterium]|nr:phosphoribosylglycinamide formyltransferase [Bacillota bacterium]
MSIRLAVLVSGRGSNLQAIIDAIRSGRLQASAEIVVSDAADAPAVARALEVGIPAVVVRRRDYSSRAEFELALAGAAEKARPDLVVLAGFMRLLGPAFLDRFPGRVINIHPSLLPAFPGLEAQRQALEYGVRFSGCTVHYVDYGMDSGAIIDQRVVEVMPGDSVDSLSARILEQEHELLVDVIGRLGQQMNEHANEHANERVNARVGEQVGGKTGGKTGRKIGEGRCARRGQEQA